MNNLHKIIAIFSIISVISISCSKLTDVNNIKPINQLGEDEAGMDRVDTNLVGSVGQCVVF